MAKSILSDDRHRRSSRNSSLRETRATSPFSRASPRWLSGWTVRVAELGKSSADHVASIAFLPSVCSRKSNQRKGRRNSKPLKTITRSKKDVWTAL